jgi:TPR repeat protein
VSRNRCIPKAAEQQNSQGEYSLGVLYLEGSGTPKDEAEAIRWFEKAAGHWNLDAMNNLVALHYRQRQTGDHLVQAYMWTFLAASAGHAASQNNLEPIRAGLSAEQLREAEQAAATWQATHPRP